MHIRDLLLSVTNFCLGSCVYCNLKSLARFDHDAETTVADIDQLLCDPLLAGMENIHITGGEPILSPKTYGIFKVLKRTHPNVRLNMPVSGFFPEATYRYCKELLELMPQMRVDVSIDGPQEIHALTRGDTYDDVMRTVHKLKTLDLALQLQVTVSDSNFMHLEYVHELAGRLGLSYYVTFPHWGSRFGHSKDQHLEHDGAFTAEVDRQIRNTWCAKRELNMRTWVVQKAIWEGKTVLCDCHMGKTSIDVDPFGNVYPCMVYNAHHIFGNIKRETLSHMMASSNATKIFEEIDARACQPCLMPCCPSKTNFTIDGEAAVFK